MRSGGLSVQKPIRFISASMRSTSSVSCARVCSLLEFAIGVVRLDRIHPADERTPHLAFRRHHFFSLVYDLLDQCARNDDHTVAVAQEVIAAGDGHIAD